MAAIFAARYPERVSALVRYGCMLRAVRDDDLPWLPDAAERDARSSSCEARGRGADREPPLAPEKSEPRGDDAADALLSERSARRRGA